MVKADFIEMNIANAEAFNRTIIEAKRKVSDLSFPFSEIARDFRKSNKAQFKLKGSGQYTPLSEPYRRAKKKKNYRAPILVGLKKDGRISGRLRNSVTTKNDENVSIVTKDSLTFGTTVPYAKYVQFGTNKMPKRPFLYIGPEAPRSAPSIITGRLERATMIIEKHVEQQLGEAGL